jgi:hypothetical protein
MIRYVHIGDQILDGANQFALYDTVTDQFLTFYGHTPDCPAARMLSPEER